MIFLLSLFSVSVACATRESQLKGYEGANKGAFAAAAVSLNLKFTIFNMKKI